MASPPARSVRFSVSITPDTAQRLAAAAEWERRSLSAMVNILLERALSEPDGTQGVDQPQQASSGSLTASAPLPKQDQARGKR